MTYNNVIALMTSRGVIVIGLYPDYAPKACENFVALAKAGKYDNGIFHRVIPNFMIQAGRTENNLSIWNSAFEDEITDQLRFDHAGVLAMANKGKNTNGSQFFITLAPAMWLNGKHTIFGEVLQGLEVIKEIAAVSRDKTDKPLEDQIIERIIYD
jgi:peptidylprolyl isomerase